MQILIISAVGIAIVLIAILWLKLHPFFALIMGSMFILLATPNEIFLETELQSKIVKIQAIQHSESTVELDRAVMSGRYRLWIPGSGLAGSDFVELDATSEKSSRVKIDSPIFETLSVGHRMVSDDAFQAAQRSRFGSVAQRLSAGLAGTFQKIGLPITMAAIIGTCLLESGSARRLVVSLTQCFGPTRVAPALTLSGFLLGVPVFFDTVFYLLLPLAKAVGKQDTRNYVMAVMAIIVGATMAHSLVPPTPGPLLVAAELGVSIGAMMLGGTIVGGSAAMVGFAYGAWCSRWVQLENPESVSVTSESDSVANNNTDRSNAVPIAIAALPLAVPIACLGGVEIWKAATGDKQTGPWLDLLSDSGFVLFCTAIIAMVILRRVVSGKASVPMITRSVADAGTILMLTCAGGAFGAALKQLQIATAVAEQFSFRNDTLRVVVFRFRVDCCHPGCPRICNGSDDYNGWDCSSVDAIAAVTVSSRLRGAVYRLRVQTVSMDER